MTVCRRDPDLRVVGRDACAVHVCSYNQRKVTSRCSHPDAEEMAAEGQVNVHVIGRTISRGDLRLDIQPVVAICDWSYNQL